MFSMLKRKLEFSATDNKSANADAVDNYDDDDDNSSNSSNSSNSGNSSSILKSQVLDNQVT